MQYSCSDATDLLTIFGIRTHVLSNSVVSVEGCAQDLRMIVFGCPMGFVVAFVQAVLLSGVRSVIDGVDRLMHMHDWRYPNVHLTATIGVSASLVQCGQRRFRMPAASNHHSLLEL